MVVLWTIILGLVLLLVGFAWRKSTFWTRRGVPYFDSFPLVGVSFSVFTRRKSFIQMVQDIYDRYQDCKYIGYIDFGNPILMIRDPEIIKEVTVKSFDNFTNHKGFVEPEFDPLMSRNVFSLRDERWREMRTTLTPSFTANKMKFLFTLVSKCSEDFVAHLKEHPEITDDFEMKDAFTRYTNDVIATSAFGVTVNSMKDPDNEFYLNGRDASSFDGFGKIVKFILAQFFPKFMNLLGLTFLSKKTNAFLKGLIYETVRVREEKGIVRPDLIHLLMQARNNDKGIEMTNDDIIAQAVIFFLAGFETSARLMCCVAHILSHHPEVQDRLREEVDSILEDCNGDINYDTLAKMKYMDMVVNETLRLYPAMPFTDRVCTKPYELEPSMEGYPRFTVERDMTLWIPIYGLHHDPRYFPDPEKFDPERFSEENKNSINPYAYLPFGVGPRRCIGDRFALMETKILMTHLLQHFVLKPSPKTTKDIIYDKKTFNLAPACGFWMKMERRSQ